MRIFNRIPPEKAWPLIVVSLLLTSVVLMTVVILAARSDGGVQVVENYYQQALEWDATADEQRASDALGWQLNVQLMPDDQAQAHVLCQFEDRESNPLTELDVQVSISRPARSGVLHEVTLEATDVPGQYAASVRLPERGLWDFDLVAARGEDRFITRIRKEW